MNIIEQGQIFSQSCIWQLQRDYFQQEGIEAWRTGELPHYITSNPVIGKTYAELVLAFLRDLSIKGHHSETVYLLELGAGHGRLCYHFFKHFEKYYNQSAIPLPPFRYILSDFTEASIEFWKGHPRLQPFLSKGWLDFTKFDAEIDAKLELLHTAASIAPGDLDQPLIVIGNYFFDTIPQELFRIEDQKISKCLLTLSTESDPATLKTADFLESLVLNYNYRKFNATIYQKEPALNALIQSYREQLTNTHLLFPHVGIRCVDRLRQLSRNGLLLLSADKGNHRIQDLEDQGAPELATHGSFSLTVNFHAFRQHCMNERGLALFPLHQQAHLDLGCMLFIEDGGSYQETINAYERFVNDFGPDDYFSLKKLIEKHFDTMTFNDIMGTIRLSGYDARIFNQMYTRLLQVLPEISDPERWSIFQAIHRIWDTYYPLGEEVDLAFNLGDLLYSLAFYEEAIIYYELSGKIYGRETNTQYNIALCHCLLGDFAKASPIISQLKAAIPDDEALKILTKRFENELNDTTQVQVSS